ncbi:MAG: MBL fold metallo-hydrolase [Oscillospiraceae bacterium]|nr:MBL fold metallo-hydrolase [Oscillospiraceae bacterium]
MEQFKSQVHQLDENTYYIDQFDVHIYLFIGKDKTLLTDTGFACFPDLKQIVTGLTDLPLIVMNSHGHPDHSGAVLSFDRVLAHPDAFESIRQVQGGEGGRGELVPLADGEEIDIGGRTFQVILCPGHASGHIALLDRANRVLLPGDMVQREHVVMYMPHADVKQYRESLLQLKALSGAYDTLLPCHGEVPMEPGQIDNVLACIDAYLAGQLTATDGVGPEGTACKEYILNGFSLMLP